MHPSRAVLASTVAVLGWLAAGCVALRAQAAWTKTGDSVLVSGVATRGPGASTWFFGMRDASFVSAVWNGSSWVTQPIAAPPARHGHAVAYDPIRGRVVLFGGRTPDLQSVFGDLWEFDGLAWVQRNPSGPVPAARFAHAMAWDAGRNRVVVATGSLSPGLFHGGTTEVWEWDGTVWTQRSVFGGIARVAAALGYDPVRAELVLHGGHTWGWLPTPLSSPPETWALPASAGAWQLRASGPAFGSGAACVWDPVRSRLVSVGGVDLSNGGPDLYVSEPWLGGGRVHEWDGTAWSTTPPLPSRAAAPAVAFDAALGQVVALGGVAGLGLDDTAAVRTVAGWHALGTTLPNWFVAMSFDPARARALAIETLAGASRTWEWDGVSWRVVAASSVTPFAPYARLAWDPVRQETLLMTGVWPGSDELWSWNGTQWSLLAPPLRPSPRYEQALATDPVRNVVVLLGGYSAPATTWSDHWEWNGSSWALVAATTAVGPHAGGRMAYDATRSRMMLHGGSGFPAPTTTYELVAGQWQAATPAPLSLDNAMFVHDGARQRMVLAGNPGSSGCVSYDFDGTSWQLRSGPTALRPFSGVHDAVTQRILTVSERDVWVFATPSPAAVNPFGAGCAGSAGIPQLLATALPWLGDTLAGTVGPLSPTSVGLLSVGSSAADWNGVPLPLPLAAIGAPGCAVLAAPSVLQVLPTGFGAVAWSFALPPTASFAGQSLYAQGAVLDPAANPLGLVTTAGLQLICGLR